MSIVVVLFNVDICPKEIVSMTFCIINRQKYHKIMTKTNDLQLTLLRSNLFRIFTFEASII